MLSFDLVEVVEGDLEQFVLMVGNEDLLLLLAVLEDDGGAKLNFAGECVFLAILEGSLLLIKAASHARWIKCGHGLS